MADFEASHSSFFSSHLSIDQLVDVIDLLKRSGYPETRWQDLGLRLGLHKNTLDAIERNHPGDVSRCLTESLSKWLRKADNVNSRGGATFDSLSDALRSMDEIAVADKLDQERRNAMATCIFDTHCHNLSQSLCDPVSVAWMLYGERLLVRQAVTSVESGSPFIAKQREALLDVLKEVIRLNYKNLQTFAVVLCKFPRNTPLGEAIHTDYDNCFPSNKEFIKVKMEEDGSSSRATSSTDSTSLPTGPVEIPIRKSMSQDFSSIRASYGRMMYNVRKVIRNHQVDFDELIDFTISCSSDIEEKLDKSSDVASVLRVIEKKECSLIDTSLISAVVEEFRVTEAERYIEEYKEKLSEFCRSISVTLCLKEKFEANPSLQCETATYVFDWRPDEKKLKDITDILSKTSGKFVKIKFIDTGYSIMIACSFPHFLTGALITKFIENLNVLIKNGLKKISIGCYLIWEKQKLEEMEQLLEEDVDVIKANQGDIYEDPYDLQGKPVGIEKKEKQLTAPDSEDSDISLDTSFAIVTSRLKKEKEANKRLEEKLRKMKEKHFIQRMLLLTNTGSALSRVRRGMKMEIEELMLYLKANNSDIQDQNAALAENKREIEYLQEQISSTSVQLLMRREENERHKTAIKDEVNISHKEKKTPSEKEKIEGDKKLEKKDLNIAEDFENSDASLEIQLWFHGQLPRDRADADALLEDHKHVPGAFLVRINIAAYYFLSFVHDFKIYHVRIFLKDEGKIKYYINDDMLFDSIPELVNYYRQHHLNIYQISQMLTTPIHRNKAMYETQPEDSFKGSTYISIFTESQPWYNKDASRKSAEYMLEQVLPKEDGTFLVRPSSHGGNTWAISLISGNSIHHMKIDGDGGHFKIGDLIFNSMIGLIDYYKQHRIYADTKLTYPINEEILRQNYPIHQDVSELSSAIEFVGKKN